MLIDDIAEEDDDEGDGGGEDDNTRAWEKETPNADDFAAIVDEVDHGDARASREFRAQQRGADIARDLAEATAAGSKVWHNPPPTHPTHAHTHRTV